MTPRDRTVLTAVVSLALLAGAWFFLLAPTRKDAKALDDQIAAASTRVQAAKASVAAGETAQLAYRADYGTVARLGKAVPTDDDVPSLVFQIESAAKRSRVDFRSFELAAQSAAPAAGTTSAAIAPVATTPSGTTGATGATGARGAPAAAVPTTVGPAGFPTMPFDLAFVGSFFSLKDFLARMDRFTQVQGDKITVRGRLLTVDGFALKATAKGFPQMQASLRATAYQLPAAVAPAVPAAGAVSAGVPAAAPATPPAAGAPVPAPTTAAATGVGTR